MAEPAWLDSHPQRYPQQRARSAWGWAGPSGLVGVHVAVVPLGTPRANVRDFIVTRSDPGGYHEIIDPEGYTVMARDDMMTWHIAEANLNGPAWGISFAATPDDMRADDPRVQSMIRIGGARIRAFWERQHIDPRKAAVWLNRQQAHAAAVGLVHHGIAQPSDRYDAWVKLSNGAPHPDFDRLNQMLVDAILGSAGPIPNPEDEMTPAQMQELKDFIKAGNEAERNHMFAALDQRAERIEANTKRETERTRDEFVALLVDKGVIKADD